MITGIIFLVVVAASGVRGAIDFERDTLTAVMDARRANSRS